MENKKNKKVKLSINVTPETSEILKEIAEDYGSTMGISVTMLAKNWKREKEAIKMVKMAESVNMIAANSKTI